MPLSQHSRLAQRLELLGRVLANRLEHEEAVVADRLEEARVDEGGKAVEVSVADLLRGGNRMCAGEDGEPRQELPAGVVEKVVAPLDGRTKGALALGRVAR